MEVAYVSLPHATCGTNGNVAVSFFYNDLNQHNLFAIY